MTLNNNFFSKSLICLLSLTALLHTTATNCHAQRLRGSLSQLDFDSKKEAQYNRARLAEQKRQILEEATKTQSLQAETKEVIIPIYLNFREIIPGKTGVVTDTNSTETVTSSVSWEKGSSNNCSKITNAASLTQKSRALNEVLSKFTGSVDAYRSLTKDACRGACNNQEHKAYPTSINLRGVGAEKFKEVELNGSCHFRFEKGTNANFQSFVADTLSCSCLPEN